MGKIGVIGPQDLVTTTTTTCDEFTGVQSVALPYDDVSQTPELMRRAAGDVNAWLFTGVVPHHLAEREGLLDRPATYLDYSDTSLLLALVRLLRDGRPVEQLSIDTLEKEHVLATLREAEIPANLVRIMPFRAGVTTADFIRFHERAADQHPGTIAVTCVRSVYDTLRQKRQAIRLVPARSTVRAAVRHLVSALDTRTRGDAQVVIGLVEAAPEAEPGIQREMAALGGTVVRENTKQLLVITTRGPLEEATNGLTELSMVKALRASYGHLRIGFGIGGSAAEARDLAARALGRAHAAGRTAAVVSLRGDVDLPLLAVAKPRSDVQQQVGVLAQRAGLSVTTILRLQGLVEQRQSAHQLTTRDVADALGVELRTARRMLKRLERSGLARVTGTLTAGGSGRPFVVYSLHL